MAKDTIKKYLPIVQVELRQEHCKKFGYDAQDLVNFMMNIDDYVMCDFDGIDLGKVFTKQKGVMDRFFVHRKLYQSIEKKDKSA